jgi:hypothetical protein
MGEDLRCSLILLLLLFDAFALYVFTTVSVIEIDTKMLVGSSIPVGANPSGIDYDPDGFLLYEHPYAV